jgi:hypothetical protein
VKRGESVEAIARSYDGAFEIRTTVSVYRAQRVVLAIGTRGKPRTLQVPGENLPKVYNLLEDPDVWRERWACVVGGGDSACEAALALADAGAKVIVSYRGTAFSRASPRNKASIEQYAAENRLRVALGSQVLAIEPDGIAIALGDGTQQRYRNDAVFVLIGSDPPVAWLERLGIRFVERPHSYQLGRTDLLVRRMTPAAMPCPEVATVAAAQVLGQPIDPAIYAPPVAEPLPPPPPPASGPRKWLQSATSVFATRFSNQKNQMPPPPRRVRTAPGVQSALPGMPTPLIGAPGIVTPFGPQMGTQVHHGHSGDGRRDQLLPNERTRVLRMLRDDGGQDEYTDENVHIGSLPVRPSARPSLPMIPDDWVIAEPSEVRPVTASAHVPIVDDEQVHIGAMPPMPPAPKPAAKPAPKFVDSAKTEIASFDHLHGEGTTERRWPDRAPGTDPHVPDFDDSNDD